MAESVQTAPPEIPHHVELNFWSKYVFSTDHKIIAFQYMITGVIMGLIGGFFAYAFRMQLAFPGMEVPGFGLVSPAEYNALVTNHGTIMIFWVAMPVLIAAFGNYLIPLMIGADDMVFPKINRLSYQIFLLSAIVLVISFFVPGGGFGGAWTAYPPLLDRLPTTVRQGRVQPHGHGLVALGAGGGAGIRGLPAGRHQLHHHRHELPRPRHEALRHPDGGLDDRGRQYPLHGVRGAADRRRGHALHGSDHQHGLLRPESRR
jgi:hypothetical protein